MSSTSSSSMKNSSDSPKQKRPKLMNDHENQTSKLTFSNETPNDFIGTDEDEDEDEDDYEGENGEEKSDNKKIKSKKKTKGRVKIKMEFIENKIRRYTTFSKRKTGIMKKAYELSTLTGTQVMLLVASETGHVYTFATKKLQPMITSEVGRNLIQQCLGTSNGNSEVKEEDSCDKNGDVLSNSPNNNFKILNQSGKSNSFSKNNQESNEQNIIKSNLSLFDTRLHRVTNYKHEVEEEKDT